MIFGYLTLATALIISLSAAVYSILGLTAIFAAAFWPIVIMGGSLEVGKIVTTLWLHKYWDRAEIQYKLYLCSAVAVLMFLTSMGVFGFLSKAHSDQALVSGDVTSKLEIYDQKIKTAKENIESDRKQIKQMDEAVDQVMARSTTEGGADKSNAIRRGQARDRASLAKDIEANQKIISQLNDQAAPIRAEVRKVEAEVGPIKYIAAMVYGDNPDANLLEHAVRWVIILIVSVFDPLALTLLLAASKSIEWEHGIDLFNLNKRKEEEEEEADRLLKQGITNSNTNDNVPLADDIPIFDREEIPLEELVIDKPIAQELTKANKDPHPPGWMFPTLATPTPEEEIQLSPEDLILQEKIEKHKEAEDQDPLTKMAKTFWAVGNPDQDLDDHHVAFHTGEADQLPWHNVEHINSLPISDGERQQLISRVKETQLARGLDQLALQADNAPSGPTGEVRGFGTSFPTDAVKGDMYLRVDRLPSVLYKFNGTNWIEVDKALSDSHAYDGAYIDHLIEKISSGEYDPDLLSDAERAQIELRLNQKSA